MNRGSNGAILYPISGTSVDPVQYPQLRDPVRAPVQPPGANDAQHPSVTQTPIMNANVVRAGLKDPVGTLNSQQQLGAADRQPTNIINPAKPAGANNSQSGTWAPTMNVTHTAISSQAHVESGGTAHVEQQNCTISTSSQTSPNTQQQPTGVRQPNHAAAKVNQQFSGQINAQNFNAYVERWQGGQ